ncbi:hypothetical protein OKW47_002236 [Paraburkholderia atlantica]
MSLLLFGVAVIALISDHPRIAVLATVLMVLA